MTVLEFKDRVDAIRRRVDEINKRMAVLGAQNNANAKESNDLYRERAALEEAAATFQKYLGGKE